MTSIQQSLTQQANEYEHNFYHTISHNVQQITPWNQLYSNTEPIRHNPKFNKIVFPDQDCLSQERTFMLDKPRYMCQRQRKYKNLFNPVQCRRNRQQINQIQQKQCNRKQQQTNKINNITGINFNKIQFLTYQKLLFDQYSRKNTNYQANETQRKWKRENNSFINTSIQSKQSSFQDKQIISKYSNQQSFYSKIKHKYNIRNKQFDQQKLVNSLFLPQSINKKRVQANGYWSNNDHKTYLKQLDYYLNDISSINSPSAYPESSISDYYQPQNSPKNSNKSPRAMQKTKKQQTKLKIININNNKKIIFVKDMKDNLLFDDNNYECQNQNCQNKNKNMQNNRRSLSLDNNGHSKNIEEDIIHSRIKKLYTINKKNNKFISMPITKSALSSYNNCQDQSNAQKRKSIFYQKNYHSKTINLYQTAVINKEDKKETSYQIYKRESSRENYKRKKVAGNEDGSQLKNYNYENNNSSRIMGKNIDMGLSIRITTCERRQRMVKENNNRVKNRVGCGDSKNRSQQIKNQLLSPQKQQITKDTTNNQQQQQQESLNNDNNNQNLYTFGDSSQRGQQECYKDYVFQSNDHQKSEINQFQNPPSSIHKKKLFSSSQHQKYTPTKTTLQINPLKFFINSQQSNPILSSQLINHNNNMLNNTKRLAISNEKVNQIQRIKKLRDNKNLRGCRLKDFEQQKIQYPLVNQKQISIISTNNSLIHRVKRQQGQKQRQFDRTKRSPSKYHTQINRQNQKNKQKNNKNTQQYSVTLNITSMI